MAFSLVIPGLFNKVLRFAKEGNNYLVGVVIMFLNFREKVINFYKIIKVKVNKNFFINVIYAGGADGLSWVMKYSMMGEI